MGDANGMSGFLVVNPRSGKGTTHDELVSRARELGVDTHVMASGDDPAVLAREAPDGPLGAAGGDGSLAAIAEVAIERSVPFVAVPFGTRNHFARDLGLDRDDPLAALEAFVGGQERRVDIGRVDGRLFLNNVSLGLYARLVHRREQHRRRREALARLRAFTIVLRNRRPLDVTVDGDPLEARVLLVANNHYALDLFSVGERDRLDEGRLYLYAATGWLPRSWQERSGESFVVDAPAGKLAAAIDGEPEELETPLRFEIEPAALRVLLPKS
jgi:diacylglycerol kinase family enzyme